MYWGPGAVAAIPAAALAALLPCRGLSLRFTRRAARQPVTPPSREVRPRVPCVGPDASHRRGSRSHPDRRTVVDSVIAPGWSYPLCACSEFAPAHRPLRVRPHWRRRRATGCRTGTPTPSVPRTTVNGGLNVRIRIWTRRPEVERSQRPAMHTVSRYNYVGGRCGLAGTAVAAEDCAVVVNAPRAAANTFPDPALKLP